MYFAAALQNATNTIVENQRLITKVYFPRLALPLSAVLSGLVDFGVSFLMFVAMMVYYGIRPERRGAMAARLSVAGDSDRARRGALAFGAERDLSRRALRAAVSRAILDVRFARGVPSSLVPVKWRWLYGLNPMAGVIEGFRWSLTGRGDPPGRLIFVSAGVVIVVLLSGIGYFQKMETTVADVV